MATCKQCGKANLAWFNSYGRWFLHEEESHEVHACHASAYDRAQYTELKANEPKPRNEDCTCGRCAGTGSFITRVENGIPRGPGGICFQCEGKGYQNDADRKRNYWYELKGRKIYI